MFHLSGYKEARPGSYVEDDANNGGNLPTTDLEDTDLGPQLQGIHHPVTDRPTDRPTKQPHGPGTNNPLTRTNAPP